MSNEYEPDVVSPPGDALLDILEEREMKVQDLSKLTSMSEQMIHRILSGLEPVTPAIASELEDALGIPAPFWNRREFMYQQWLKSKGIETPSSSVPADSSKPHSSASLFNKISFMMFCPLLFYIILLLGLLDVLWVQFDCI